MKIHHIGIIIPDRSQMDIWQTLFGCGVISEHYIDEYQATLIFCETDGTNGPAIEFIIPDGGTLKKFNKGRGGLHHIAFQVDSIEDVRKTIKDQHQIDLLEDHNVRVDHLQVNFLPPFVTRGVIIEYVQEDGTTYRPPA